LSAISKRIRTFEKILDDDYTLEFDSDCNFGYWVRKISEKG
jgi:hypothetical protein